MRLNNILACFSCCCCTSVVLLIILIEIRLSEGKLFSSSANTAKIESGLFATDSNLDSETTNEEKRDVIVTFGTFEELKDIALQIQSKYGNYPKEDRIYALYEAMHSYTSKCQGDANSYLQTNDYKYKGMWSTNSMVIRGADKGCVEKLSTMKDVTFISEDKSLPLIDPVRHTESKFIRSEISSEFIKRAVHDQQNTPPADFTTRLTYGLSNIHVPEAWNYPNGAEGSYYGKKELRTGKGIVVAIIDSGVNLQHESLKNNFREYAGWKDAYNISLTPVDIFGHGTHCAGTVCGSGGIGVAPGSVWIACRGCLDADKGCLNSALLDCCQWVLCPHDVNSTEPDNYKNCYTAPDVVSNSWGGGQGLHLFDRCALALRAAGIIPIWSNGNSGPECKTANSPGDSEFVIGVGATDADNNLASFSSRGPNTDGLLKPDVSAPGVFVLSALFNTTDGYIKFSGTSMAAPHVAGLVALMQERCKLPYHSVLSILQETADRDSLGVTDQVCGGTKSNEFPNNFYGAGKVNALEAIKKVIQTCGLNQQHPYFYYDYNKQFYHYPQSQGYSIGSRAKSPYSMANGYYTGSVGGSQQGNSGRRYYYRYPRSSPLSVPYSTSYFRYFPYNGVIYAF